MRTTLLCWLAAGAAACSGCAPLIHDVSTDTEDPPRFVTMLGRRKDQAVYGGASVAARQKRAYPDLAPLKLKEGPADAFKRAEAAVRAMGWELVASEPAEGRLEATDTSRLFKFKDDIVIRVRAEGFGSRVDVRSVSRVGKGDLGANAKRIRAYLGALAEQQ